MSRLREGDVFYGRHRLQATFTASLGEFKRKRNVPLNLGRTSRNRASLHYRMLDVTLLESFFFFTHCVFYVRRFLLFIVLANACSPQIYTAYSCLGHLQSKTRVSDHLARDRRRILIITANYIHPFIPYVVKFSMVL